MTPNKKVSSSIKFYKIGLPLAMLLVLLAGGLWIDGAGLRQAGLSGRGSDCPVALTAESVGAYRGISAEMVSQLGLYRSLDLYDVCAIPQDKLERAIFRVETPKPDQPDKALEWRNLTLMDENGYIPADGYARAAEHMRGMFSPEFGDVAGIAPGSWTWIGPGNIGGRVRSILIDPGDADNMWAGSVAGGIWKTTNGGATWSAVDDFMTNLAVASMAMDTGTSTTMYAGTGEGFYNGDAIRGAGIFRTLDGGVTWTQIPSTATSDFYWVNRLAAHPTNHSIMLAATSTGIWRSTNVDNATIGNVTWTEVQTLNGTFKDVDFDPNDGNKAVASGSYGRAYYSIDAGVNWIAATGITGSTGWLNRAEVAYAPSSSNIVYLSLYSGTEIYKSVDGGQSYSLVTSAYDILGSQGWYDNVIWVDPTDATTLIVGGIDLWRSTNSGSAFTKISQWWSAPSSAHADHHYIVEHPSFDGSANKTVFFGNDGGVYKTTDVYTVALVTGWTELNNNLGITQFYGAAGDTITGNITGGTQDNGTLYYSGGTETWTSPFGGDGGFSAADGVTAGGPYYYGEYVYLKIHRGVGGGSHSYIYSGISDATTNCANFIAPFILDPNTPTTMLAGGCSLWRSTNVNSGSPPTWASIKSPISGSSRISAIAVAPGNSNIIWVGHNNGNVYKTTNGLNASPTWTRVDANTPNLPNRYITRITIDAVNNNHVYVTLGGFNSDNVWKTEDGGTNWADKSGSGGSGLPSVPVRSLVIHPYMPSWIYAGTEVGVFASVDGGATWSLPQDGPANVSVDELFWMNTTLVAATHGRGLFTAYTGDTPTVTITSTSPNPSVLGQAVTVQFTVTGSSGAPIGTVTVTDSASGASCNASVATGQCDITMNSAGARTLTATYGGDSVYHGRPDTAGQTVNKATPTVTITSDSADPSVTGESVTVTYTVTYTVGTPTGTITVTDSVSGEECSSSVATGQCNILLPDAGGRTLTAVYGGDSNFNGNSDTEPHTVNKANTTTTITSDTPDPSGNGLAVTVQFSVVVDSPGSGTPTGTVTVTDSLSIATCNASAAAGQCDITLPTNGSGTLTATYAGDSDFNGSFADEPHAVITIGTDTIGSFDPTTGNFKLRNTNDAGAADLDFLFAADISDGIPLAGDWDGDGTDTIGVFSPSLGEFRLRNSNDAGAADITLQHNILKGGQPLVGDWDGDGIDTIGIFLDGKVYMRNTNSIAPPDIAFNFGSAGDIPLAGDWDGDGIDTIGVFDPVAGEFQLRNSNSSGAADITIQHKALKNRTPLAGDWDGDGTDTLGIYVKGKVLLRNTNTMGGADLKFNYGGAGLLPVTGDWDGS